MTYEEAIAYLEDACTFGIKPGLMRIHELLVRLGNPHETYKTVHVTGTNGKGSVYVSSFRRIYGENEYRRPFNYKRRVCNHYGRSKRRYGRYESWRFRATDRVWNADGRRFFIFLQATGWVCGYRSRSWRTVGLDQCYYAAGFRYYQYGRRPHGLLRSDGRRYSRS